MSTPSGGRAEQTPPGAQGGVLRPQWSLSLTAVEFLGESTALRVGVPALLAQWLSEPVSLLPGGPLGESGQMAPREVPGS